MILPYLTPQAGLAAKSLFGCICVWGCGDVCLWLWAQSLAFRPVLITT